MPAHRTDSGARHALHPVTGVRRIQQFDGLRAVAVLAVMAAHTGRPIGVGGGFGVDVFFVLSGFLITGVLYGEWQERRSISLRRFYARRALRLYPALIALVVVLTPFGIELSKRESWSSWGEAVAIALTYTSNLAVLISDTQVTGSLGHTWSLAVEEQFYLLWPILLVVLLRRDLHPRVLVAAVGLIAVACLSLFLLLSADVPGTISVAPLYYRPDARFGELLLGAALALALATARSPLRREGHLLLSALVPAALAGFLLARQMTDVATPRLVPLVALCSLVIVARLATSDRAITSRVLSLAPLPAIGRISYALYLWHLPIFALVRPGTFGLPGWTQDPVRVSLTFVAAALSYRFVERAFLRRKDRLGGTPVAGIAAVQPTSPTGAAPAAQPPGPAPA